MTDPFVMQNLKPFQNLFRDLCCIRFGCFMVRHISAHVSLANILCCKKDFVCTLEPAKELDKQVTMLENT